VIRYTEQVVAEWGARGARIVSVSPGTIATPMGRLEFDNQPAMKQMVDLTPIQRWGEPDDIAAAVEFLCSTAASYISGTDLRVDGGITARLHTIFGVIAGPVFWCSYARRDFLNPKTIGATDRTAAFEKRRSKCERLGWAPSRQGLEDCPGCVGCSDRQG